ncbi:MAG: hypothetical protein JNM27_15830 [Leptospirales bacterium]|nr:hypothetical protein [Leptospirales bacterium]
MRKLIVLVSGITLLFASCAVSQVGLPSNTVFYNATGAGFSGQYVSDTYRNGEACAFSAGWYIPFIALGDASIATAARKSGITKITSVSHRTSMGHIIQEFCTVVRGY